MLSRLILLAIGAVLGLVVGGILGWTQKSRSVDGAEQAPLPHHVPEHPGGLSLRFAMVHDVIHERFPKHGPDYYRERNRLTQAELSELAPDDPTRFPLCDDLAAGLDRLGKSKEAVLVMREKLSIQEDQGLEGMDLYTSYANLGTFLIHGSFRRALTGDAEARREFYEGITFIRSSVEVNPEAHFGRERWQAAIAEFIRATMDDPNLLKTYDCLGNRLDLATEEALSRLFGEYDTDYGKPQRVFYSNVLQDPYIVGLEDDFSFLNTLQAGLGDDPEMWEKMKLLRNYITRIGAEEGWENVPVPSHREPVPFDEPTLGIIGMWRQGGGANPHFALALGETMLRVGQRYIAWTAYERASRLAQRYSPDPEVQQFLRDHCKQRQADIEASILSQTSEDSSPRSDQPPSEQVAALRTRFDAELRYGERFQREYQEYETARIANGKSIHDDDFFDDFEQGREPIASPVGSEELYRWMPYRATLRHNTHRAESWGLFGMGLGAMLAALLGWVTPGVGENKSEPAEQSKNSSESTETPSPE